jgi:hypothetical protein
MRRQSLRCVYMVTGLVVDVLFSHGFLAPFLKRLRKFQDRRQELVP